MATFYSIRNLLEEGKVLNNDKNNQFLASIVTSYPCLDVWVQSHGREIECRVMYIQCNSGYIADPQKPWTRNGEEPKVFQQFRGDWPTVRSNFITALPKLARLSDEKRHGLSNFGSKQPFEGGGLIFNYNDQNQTLTVTGRYGALEVIVDGEVLPFERLNYDFTCCIPEVTVTNIDGEGTINDRGIPGAPGGGMGGYTPGGYDFNTGGTASNFRLQITEGYAVPSAAYYQTAAGDFGPGVISQRGEWCPGDVLAVPFGSKTSVIAPTLDPGYTYGSSPWSGGTQGFGTVNISCGLAQTGANTWEGQLQVPDVRFTIGESYVNLLYDGDPGGNFMEPYASAAFGSIGQVQGTLRVTHTIGSPGWGFTWTPDDPAATMGFGLSVSSALGITGTSFIGSSLGGGGNLLGCRDAISQWNKGAGLQYYKHNSIGCLIDSLDTSGEPPPSATPLSGYVIPEGPCLQATSYSSWVTQCSVSLP